MTYGELTPIVGAVLRFTASITDISGNPVDPDTVKLTFRNQGQASISYTWVNPPGADPDLVIINSGTGEFYADYALPNSGNWTYQWDAQPLSGTDVTATSAIIEGEILVSASGV